MKNPYLFRANTLYLGDCLEVMNAFLDNGKQVDLIYLDPPFNSNADYSILFKRDTKGQDIDEQSQFTVFQDTWYWTTAADERMTNLKNAVASPVYKVMQELDIMIPQTPMLAYLSYMAERLVVMHRLLKDTGSLYLHCDPTASHYLKLILDGVFGKENFRNEIIWSYPASPSRMTNDFPRKHDVIFRFVKTVDFVFNYKDVSIPYSESSMNRIKYPANASKVMHGTKIILKKEGKIPTTVWQDIQQAYRYRKEANGYRTQKPRALLERIIKASSNKGDYVLDPFAGCGTTAEASYQLGRKFLGIDISTYAIRQICSVRLKDAPGIKIIGLPTDMASAIKLAQDKPFEFEQWAITCIPGMMPNDKQTGDGGIDGQGILLFKPIKDGVPENGLVIAQVKGGKTITPDSYQALLSKIAGGKSSVGLFITLNKLNLTPSIRSAITDAETYSYQLSAEGNTRKWSRLIFWSIEEYFNKSKSELPELPELAHPFTGRAMPQQIPSSQRELET